MVPGMASMFMLARTLNYISVSRSNYAKGLVGYDKWFLYCAVGAPGSTHDVKMLLSTNL